MAVRRRVSVGSAVGGVDGDAVPRPDVWPALSVPNSLTLKSLGAATECGALVAGPSGAPSLHAHR
jgi:hypothetical protein